jgi:hypothetical protein
VDVVFGFVEHVTIVPWGMKAEHEACPEPTMMEVTES